MSQLLDKVTSFAAAQPNAAALNSEGHLITYAELSKQLRILSERLQPYKGKCVVLDIENSALWVLVDIACVTVGIITVPVPPFFSAAQRQHAVQASGAVCLFSDKFSNGDAVYNIAGRELFISVLDNNHVVLPHNTAKITFTSGTTGDPKGVCLSQAGMEAVAASLVAMLDSELAAHVAAVLPLAVLLENVAGCYACLMAGGCYDVQPQRSIGLGNTMNADFHELTAYLYRVHASSCILVPELLRGLMQNLFLIKGSLPDMKFIAVGGAKVAPALLMKASELGLPVYQGYGLSEAGSVVAVNTPANHSIQSVGKCLPHCDVTIDDDGEILIREPAFLGYIGDSTSTSTSTSKVVYATGDIGRLDSQGYLYVTGRKKNTIITAMGRNISPEWPESELLTQPVIAQALVFGDAEKALSALLVPVSENITDTQLDQAVQQTNRTLPQYAYIRHWLRVRPFTIQGGQLTGTGRMRRQEIMNACRQQISEMQTLA